jgi:uncharacterized protein (TIGR02996 family)
MTRIVAAPLAHPDPAAPFRLRLAELAAAGDWVAFDAQCLVFADWLAERGDPEERAARCRWEFDAFTDQGRCQYWSVPLPYPFRNDPFWDCTNAAPLLHFAQQTVVLGGSRTGFLMFLVEPRYGFRQGSLLDTTIHPLGFLSLFPEVHP